MPIPFIPIAIGALIGVKGGAVIEKVKSFFRSPPQFNVHLDVNLPANMRDDVSNLLMNVQSPDVLRKMVGYYQTLGFPISAGLIAQKLQSLKG